MRQEHPSRLPLSDNVAPAPAPRLRGGGLGVARTPALLALAFAAALASAGCGPDADPYCADGDATEWLTTFTLKAEWIEDGWSVKHIQLIIDTKNQYYLHLPDDLWSPEGGRVVIAMPNDMKAGEAKKLVLLPDKGVTTMSVRAPVVCQGIREDYVVVLTWSGTPEVGDPVDAKVAPAQ